MSGLARDEPTPHSALSLQERYAPGGTCYGCGPANEKGFRIRSFPIGGEVVADWMPLPEHQAFPGVLNGGVIGTLLDCHANWCAVWHLIERDGLDHAPSTVTSEYHVRLLRPTPTSAPVHLRANVVESQGDRVTVEATLEADGKSCATLRGTFVAVKPGHPAYHRW
ncbi:MAG: PaaI family thioesterase [Anaerolineales bacterium]